MTSDPGLATAVAVAVARFGLGDLGEPAQPVDEAWSNDVFRVRADSGVYAVKLYPAVWSMSRRAVSREAMAFERTVLKRGDVAMPLPVTAGGSWLLDVATESGTRAVRCHRWVDGIPATREPLTLDVIRDAGRSLGALHAMHIPGDDTSQLISPDLQRWDGAVRGATERGFRWSRQLADATPIVRGLAADLALLRREARPMRISHRDFDPKNAVIDTTGRLVITDWDNAGPVSAAAELVIASTSFASTEDVLRQFIAGYRETGGDADKADALDMTVEAADVDWLLRNVEDCVHADPSEDPLRAQSSAEDLVMSFGTTVAALRAWPERVAALLRGGS